MPPSSRLSSGVVPLTIRSQGFQLNGFLHLPETQHPPVVIGSHGYLGSGESAKQIALAAALPRAGIAFLRFDHRGCGPGKGTNDDNRSLTGRITDLRAAIETMHHRSDLGGPIGLFGSSLGGASVIGAAAISPVACLVTCSAPVKSRTIRITDEFEVPETEQNLDLQPPLPFDISAQLDRIRGIRVIHGENDPVVPVENAHIIYRHAADPKGLVLIAGGDHRLSHPDHQERFLTEAVSWFVQGLIS